MVTKGDGAPEPTSIWDAFWASVESFERRLIAGTSEKVRESAARTAGKSIVQEYFRLLRNDLMAVGIEEEELIELDNKMQELLRLTNAEAMRKHYKAIIRGTKKLKSDLELLREKRISPPAAAVVGSESAIRLDTTLLTALMVVDPSAGLSYHQGALDLMDAERVSFKGTVNEFRECLRIVLDRLAPDENLTREKIVPEVEGKRYSMKQKAAFVFRAREVSETAYSTSLAGIDRIDETVGRFARRLYNRGSLGAHIPPDRREANMMKRYLETVLVDLLAL